MNLENLFTDKTTVSVSVVKLNNQKMNKTIFNQLLIKSPYSSSFDIDENAKFLGFVNDKEKWLVWTDGLTIFRNRLWRLRTFANFNLEFGTLEKFKEIYPTSNLSHFNSDYTDEYSTEYSSSDEDRLEMSSVLNEAESEEIRKKQIAMKFVTDNLEARQIFL